MAEDLPDSGWDPGPDQGEEAFFLDRDEDAEEERRAFLADTKAQQQSGRRGRDRDRDRSEGRGRRFTCLGLAFLLAVLGTVGYFGYRFWESRFASAPDYNGQGTGEVSVRIPEGSSLSDMGNILKRAGVVKSHDAFVEATESDQRAQGISPGTYSMRKNMSAKAAVTRMLDPKSQNTLIVAEGLRASRIYALIDKQLKLRKGSTSKVAKKTDLGLPKWAENNPEGLLFPSRYSVAPSDKPQDVLRQMVKRGTSEFARVNLEREARKVGRSPREIVTIASLIQAEAQEDNEFGKVSRVIYNRLKPGNTATWGRLDFDSTINYAMGRSTLDVSVGDTRYPSPYNTYLHKGLPPGPIDSPGHQALKAALNPTKGKWLYFVTVKPGDTRFAETKEQHDKNVREFNEERRKKGND
ncbi:endolytic transglycosylase MltG [Streptomyces sp. NPDC005438]|uniref:endolytic transglycosylase MltG n=1 Tax=Streptomyces sp. NPDC005438 TaxID=3156880 RepID=UPI0033AD84B4